ncbi:MAG: flagellar basal body rod protein FlgC [Clostridiaceae bacterium]|jgi:flagellar basal-body rod protein FlgC|nr:flagellar basal body rod protein FlgC [Clostridiaceae bacterium]
MSFFKTIDVSASALTAQSLRMDVIAQNVANATTTRTDNGEPYRRRSVVFEERQPTFAETLETVRNGRQSINGVVVSEIFEDPAPFTQVFNPTHPDADENGYVQMPNVEITQEYVDMISATRSYEANITMLNATKRMAVKALEIGK